MSGGLLVAKERDASLSFIQLVCCIAVVTLHANVCFWFGPGDKCWASANIIESVFYFAVPVFFMLTGVTLLDYGKKYSTREFIKKRINRVVIPYVVWSLIGIVFLILIHKLSVHDVNARYIFQGLMNGGSIVDYFWFFPSLFCVYLSLPIFTRISDKKKVAEYIIVIGGVFNIVFPFVINTLNYYLDLKLGSSINLPAVAGYLYFVWLGYYMYKFPPGKRVKLIVYVFALAGLAVHMVGTYRLSVNAGQIVNLYKGYNNLPCVCYSLGVFLLLRDIGTAIEKHGSIKRWVCILGEYTFSCYLIQWFLIYIMNELQIVDTSSLLYRLISPVCYFGVIVVIVFIMRKIPVVKRIVT